MTLQDTPQTTGIPTPAPAQSSQPLMNLLPLEDFITDMAMILAGTITASDNVESFTPEQLGVIFFSALGPFAKKQPDYNPEQNIGDIIALGVAVYGESVYAVVNSELRNLQSMQDMSQELLTDNAEA